MSSLNAKTVAEGSCVHVMLLCPQRCSDRLFHCLPGTLPSEWSDLDLNALNLDRNALTGDLGHGCLHKQVR